MYPKGTPHHVQARRDLTSAFKRLRYKATKETIGKKWTEDQAMEDIRVQTTGGGPSPAGIAHSRAGQRPPRPRTTLQQNMLDALSCSMKTTFEGQLLRRTAAIEAGMAYIPVQEPLVTRFAEKFVDKAQVPTVVPSDEKQRVLQLDHLRRSVTVQYEGQKLLRCFSCVGHALSLPMLDPNVGKLSVEYSSVSSLRRHFEKSHLAFMKRDAKAPLEPCAICIPKVSFKRMEFRNHAQLIHGVIVR